MISAFESKSLLYIGDVPVEPTHSGSLLLWRLLEAWPQDKLRVLEFVSSKRMTEHRLPNTTSQRLPLSRLARSRLHSLHSEILTRSGLLHRGGIAREVSKSRPEAILSVAHGWSWIWAAEFAAKEGIPFHLIVHDDFPSFHPRLGQMGLEKNGLLLRRVLSGAASVFCVSETMKVNYEREFGGDFEVLLPSRGRSQMCEQMPQVVNPLEKSPKVVYAGSINCDSVVGGLRSLAEEMERDDFGELIIYSQLKSSSRLDHPRISLRPMVPPDQTFELFKKEADFLLLMMNFNGASKRNMQMCFPSKLVDYTAVGRPILFWGPEYGSGIDWGLQAIGTDAVTTDPSPKSVVRMIRELTSNEVKRLHLGELCLAKGNEAFSFEKTYQVFTSAINE